MSNADIKSAAAGTAWRTPLVVIASGCLIGMLAFGPRSAFGFFMQPMSQDFSWGRDVFALAFAVQNLLWASASHFPARSPTASAWCA